MQVITWIIAALLIIINAYLLLDFFSAEVRGLLFGSIASVITVLYVIFVIYLILCDGELPNQLVSAVRKSFSWDPVTKEHRFWSTFSKDLETTLYSKIEKHAFNASQFILSREQVTCWLDSCSKLLDAGRTRFCATFSHTGGPDIYTEVFCVKTLVHRRRWSSLIEIRGILQ